jgi:hypothetical protein
MEAFISYSHRESGMLDVLHTHLAQLQRDRLITTWTDRQIEAGGRIDDQISKALDRAQLFIALLSPDYIDSGYCYDQELTRALAREANGAMIIVPVIVQPCDWLNTPFAKFKALPRDGKPVAEWANVHTAFLDVAQQLRKLVAGEAQVVASESQPTMRPAAASRNYRVKKEFDSIQKMDFVSQTFGQVKDYIHRYLDEVKTLDDVKARPLSNTDTKYECLLVNRNLIKTEARLVVTTEQQNSGFSVLRGNSPQLFYSIDKLNTQPQFQSFSLAWDEFHLYWSESPMAAFYGRTSKDELSSKDIAEHIFNEWLKTVGIIP